MIISVGGICGLRILWVVLIIPHWHNLLSISLSYPASWLVTAIILIVYYLKRPWLKAPSKTNEEPAALP